MVARIAQDVSQYIKEFMGTETLDLKDYGDGDANVTGRYDQVPLKIQSSPKGIQDKVCPGLIEKGMLLDNNL